MIQSSVGDDMRRYFLRMLLLATLAAGAAVAGDSDAERATLRGLEAVQVRVSDPGLDLAKDGYAREMLRTNVEVRLRQAGIPIVTAPDAAMLFANLTAVKGGFPSTYAYSIEISVVQSVKLTRDPNIISSAPTWSLSQIGQKRRAREVRDEVGPLVDRFVSLFLAMNPK